MRSEVAMPLRRVPAIANCADDDMPTTSVNQKRVGVRERAQQTTCHNPTCYPLAAHNIYKYPPFSFPNPINAE